MKNKSIHKNKSINQNIIRDISNQCQPYAKIWGYYYMYVHYFLMLACGTILLLDTNIFHLVMLLNVMMLDLIAIVICHDCPLTALERKYLKKTLVGETKKQLRSLPICFTCNHSYESTFEFLTNMAVLIALKLILLVCMQLFSVKLQS